LPSEFRFKVKWCVVKNPRGWGSKEKNLTRIFGKKHPMFLKEETSFFQKGEKVMSRDICVVSLFLCCKIKRAFENEQRGLSGKIKN